MNLITIDFETFYNKEYSLKKLTTEEYVRDPRFEVLGVAIKVNNEETEWASGTQEQLKTFLQTFDWKQSMVLAHNTMFDGAILSWIFDISPRAYTDTVCIARAVNGVETSASLSALSEKYQIGKKGDEIENTLDKRLQDFTDEELGRLGDYAVNDVDLTYDLFTIMAKGFPKKELKLIDLSLRMFVEPMLKLDRTLLENHITITRQRKEELLVDARVSKEDLMSNDKFALQLQRLGVSPPKKLSPTTGKETWAFAKSDEEFKHLLTHQDEKVQSLVAARLGSKSTLEETRTQRFIDIAQRGLLPVPVRYYAAHTGRWGGDDKINLQNLPSRGANANMLKRGIIAPEGYSIIDADSAQIEARVLAWLAEQDDLTQAFTNGEDVYKKMASKIYGVAEGEIVKDQRFVGKTTILGAGYGMGAQKFQDQLKTFGFDMDINEARRVIKVYRDSNTEIKNLWRDAQLFLKDGNTFGKEGVLYVEDGKILLPSGLYLRYDDLQFTVDDNKYDFDYKTRRGRVRIYGGKVIENVCQAIARCIIGEQMLQIAKRYRVVLTVHDSIACCVKDEEVEEAQQYIEECMRQPPEWAEGLPIDCESGKGKSYGECG